MQPVVFAAASAAIAVCLAGCGGADRTGGVALPPHQERVTRAEYGDEWPFTVDEGVIEAVPDSPALVFHAGGKTYGLNGAARGKRGQYADIGEVWAPLPGGSNLRKDITPILKRGMALQERRK